MVPSKLIEEQLGDVADYIEDADETLQVCIVILAGSHHLLSFVHSILYVAMSCKMQPQFIQNVQHATMHSCSVSCCSDVDLL